MRKVYSSHVQGKSSSLPACRFFTFSLYCRNSVLLAGPRHTLSIRFPLNRKPLMCGGVFLVFCLKRIIMGKRKGISKTVRFEVFKRDSFACVYCGRSAPEVILHIDHINPVSKGGDNDILNLRTACEDCN